MNIHENTLAILNYENYERMPVVHFGMWKETFSKWVNEGHIPTNETSHEEVMKSLGFDFGWPGRGCGANIGFIPGFDEKVVEELPDGSQKFQNKDGVIVLQMPGTSSIPAEIDHLLKDRTSWEEHYLPKLKFNEERIDYNRLEKIKDESANRELPLTISCGSMIGTIRNWVGVEGLSYLMVDDPELYDEIINTYFELIYQGLQKVLTFGIKPDFGGYWEDICFKTGPLVIPSVFDEKCGPNYRKISKLLAEHGVHMSWLDCDGMIDSLIPTWLENGVNIMFPIEVGTWGANIKPWREKYGKELRGVGGMDKRVFAKDYDAVDKEIERLKPLIELGGYIPCPDHRIPPDAIWENVQYYCEKMHNLFS